MSGDSFGCFLGAVDIWWVQGKGATKHHYNAQDGFPQQRINWLEVSAKIEKFWSM